MIPVVFGTVVLDELIFCVLIAVVLVYSALKLGGIPFFGRAVKRGKFCFCAGPGRA